MKKEVFVGTKSGLLEYNVCYKTRRLKIITTVAGILDGVPDHEIIHIDIHRYNKLLRPQLRQLNLEIKGNIARTRTGQRGHRSAVQ
jgi:hypothetical protein